MGRGGRQKREWGLLRGCCGAGPSGLRCPCSQAAPSQCWEVIWSTWALQVGNPGNGREGISRSWARPQASLSNPSVLSCPQVGETDWVRHFTGMASTELPVASSSGHLHGPRWTNGTDSRWTEVKAPRARPGTPCECGARVRMIMSCPRAARLQATRLGEDPGSYRRDSDKGCSKFSSFKNEI